MSLYDFKKIEQKWQKKWSDKKVYATNINRNKPKCYVLDMFPYPSGAGLHVGHPLGYIASDIYARYKRLNGYNVIHPIGFDAFGLPAEQYAIENGIHPSISIQQNIENFRRQLLSIGLGYDWDREIITCDPSYYKWTQWIFLQFFNSFYNRLKDKAESIEKLIFTFEKEGNRKHPFPQTKAIVQEKEITIFDAQQWAMWNKRTKQHILMQYRLAYIAYTNVNWCEALGTVLANDEVINGLSYRGGHPVKKKKMLQWNLRITEYAERLLQGLEQIEFSRSITEIQRNWIGKSIGAEIYFPVKDHQDKITVFTTRPDTLFGVDFMVLAPEHELVEAITLAEHKVKINAYLEYVAQRSEVERMADAKHITGCFTGSYAIHPITQKPIPIWISEYVLAHYGSGSIMAVPCGDQRDFLFAQHFNIPITNIFGEAFNNEQAITNQNTALYNSDFLNHLDAEEAIPKIIEHITNLNVGKKTIKYKIRDAGWSRQRYWGEPFPIIFKDDIPYPINEDDLPLELPNLNSFKSNVNGEGPLANATKWVHPNAHERRDTNTMPTHAGAAWYFLRFTDANNNKEFASKEHLDYWNQVDVYVGGSEHAVAHLLYARLWVKILYDLGYLSFEEPFKKLINQGKITGESRFVYRIKGTNKFVSFDKKHAYDTDALRVDINLVSNLKLDTKAFKTWRPEFNNIKFILNDDGDYICGAANEKMSKSYFNVINPDKIIDQYGADTLRMYELFLGPLKDSKPWDTQNIEGTYRFLKRLWRWFHPNNQNKIVLSDDTPTKQEFKILHKTIEKIQKDTESFSFNTAISTFMSCLNDLQKLKCQKRAILEPLLILLSPYIPHLTEELWEKLGNKDFILNQQFPQLDKKFLEEDQVSYVFCINGKKRADQTLDKSVDRSTVEAVATQHSSITKWIENKKIKKIIFVPNKMVNIVI